VPGSPHAHLRDPHRQPDRLIITARKADAIRRHAVEIFIDDTDEYFRDLPPKVCVLKVREPANFDFDQKKCIYGEKSG
jgi:hypothetical protein